MKDSKLKQFRKHLKLTQRVMANKIGVSSSYYNKIENGFQLPSFDFLYKLKSAFPEVSIDEMFFEK